MGKLGYRIYRNPLFLFGLAVPAYFLLFQRSPFFHAYPPRETWKSIMSLNAAMVIFYGAIGYAIGYGTLAWLVLPMLHVATAAGGWLFYIQHQFEDTTWENADDWNFQVAALQGSSYYALPPALNWITGNIGLHHIHHLNSMIPNYRLVECIEASPELAELNKLTLTESFKCARLKLWDEERRALVGFDDIRT
jgi:omega-6 fatty acid desaturase (delta-12 desaturase)